MVQVFPPQIIRHNNMHHLIILQNPGHFQPEVFQVKLGILVSILMGPDQPGPFMGFPFSWHPVT
jgi:hypothetical protein